MEPTSKQDYYQFPKVEESKVYWVADSRLKRSTELVCGQISEITRELLAQYFLQWFLQCKDSTKLPFGHMQAFLSRQGFWVALNIHRSFPKLDLQEFYQEAFTIAARPDIFLQNFDAQKHEQFRYPAYISFIKQKMQGILHDQIRKLSKDETFKRSELGLVARSSRKRVLEALAQMGLSQTEVSNKLTLWQAFQDFRKANTVEADALQNKHYQIIADRYQQITKDSQETTGEKVAQELKQIGKAIRSYLQPQVNSLDQFVNSEEEGARLGDLLPDEMQPFPIDLLIFNEEQRNLHTITTALKETVVTLDTESKQLLFLMTALHLNQTTIAQELGIKQYTLSRRNKKIRLKLIEKIIDLSSCDPSPENLTILNGFIDDSLEEYNTQVLAEIFLQVKQRGSPKIFEAMNAQLNDRMQFTLPQSGGIPTILQQQYHEWIKNQEELQP